MPKFTKQSTLYYVLSVVGGALEGFGLALLIPLLESYSRTSDTSLNNSIFSNLTKWGIDSTQTIFIFIVGVLVLRAVLALATSVVLSQLINSWTHSIRQQLFDNLYLDYRKYIYGKNSGVYMNTLLGESWAAGNYTQARMEAYSKIILITIFLLFLLLISWKLTAVLALLSMPMVVFGYAVSRKAQIQSRKIVSSNNMLHEKGLDVVIGLRSIILNRQKDAFHSEFSGYSNALRENTIKLDYLTNCLTSFVRVLVVPILVGIYVLSTSIDVPMASSITFIIVMTRTIPHVLGLQNSFTTMGRHSAGFQAVKQITNDNQKNPTTHRTHIHSVENVKFDNIRHGYEIDGGAVPLLDGLSVTFDANQITEITGASGSGKSTLLSLLLLLEKPWSGSIKINDIDSKLVSNDNYLNYIGYAGQKDYLFEGTIRHSIIAGRPEHKEWLDLITQNLGIDDNGIKLSDIVTRGGANLSGGQKQRIQIARAVYGKPDILVLDEATTELERLSEHKIVEATRRLLPNTGIVFISHNDNISKQLKPDKIIDLSSDAAQIQA